MTVSSTDFTTCQTALRRCLANGTNLTSDEKLLLLDVIQAGSTYERDTAATALEALLVTHMAAWSAAGAGDSSAAYAAALAALAAPRVAAVAGTAITDLTADNALDGRSV